MGRLLRALLPVCRVLAMAGFVALVPRSLPGQGTDSWDPRLINLKRSELEELRSRLQRVHQSPAHSAAFRRRALDEADTAAARLRDGDFQAGDRILFEVDGEAALTDTFAVGAGRAVTMASVGTLSLRGVLSSELDSAFSQFVRRFVRTPRTRARPLIRVAVEGAVIRPGFYTVPTETLLSNMLMLAGGPSPVANTAEMRLERGMAHTLDATLVRDAMTQGRTLDQLDVRSGDRVFIPQRGRGVTGIEPVTRTVGAISTLVLTLITLTRIF